MQPFEEIVEAHGTVVLRVCRALLGPVDADDAWSETFLAALRAYPDLRSDSNVRGWLVTIAHRKAIDVLRAGARAAVPAGDGLDRAVDTDPEPFDDELRTALVALPEKQQAAVIHHYLGGLPYAAVGAVLGTSTDAARRSAADGIAALRRTYAKGTTC